MQKIMLPIDFHTHKKYNDNTIFIKSYCIDQEPEPDLKFFSIGIHPWQVHEVNLDTALNKILKICKYNKNCIAIGEIGLDRLKPNFPLQLQVFKRQLQLAQKLNKPVIIHAVRTYSDLLQIRKQFPDLTWAIHGFNSNLQTALQLTEKNIYLSLGPALLKPNTKLARAFDKIPLQYIFLETDTADLHIRELYIFAQKIFPQIHEQILQNFQTFFKKTL